MTNNFETRMLVSESKGLLDGLEDYVRDVRRNLSFDNVDELTEKTAEMRMIIDRIERKVIEYEASTVAVLEDELI